VRRIAPLLLAGLLAAVAAPVVAEERPQAEPYAGIRALLEQRQEAMLGGDERDFMATVDGSHPGFEERQRLLFEGFQRIGLTEYRLELTDRYWPELTTGREVAEYGSAARPTLLHVEERYRLRGFDAQPALDDLYLTFVRRGGEWLVASDSDLADLMLLTGRKLWEFGPIETQRSEHFLYLSHPDRRSAGQAILGSAEQALSRLNEAWPLPWSRQVVLLAPSSTEELRRILQATFDLDVFVAFAYSSVDRRLDYDLTGHRIIFNWENFSQHDETVQQTILVHELLHVATREMTGPMVPAFVEEGLAEWASKGGSTYQLNRRVAGATFDRELPRDYQFFTGPDEDILLSYEESYTAARYAVARYGTDAVARMYRILGGVRQEPGTPLYHVDRAMRRAFGTDLETFQDRWATWVLDTL
jgi:hypothetical protein